ncbi:MAG: deoxyguanosinetriphosphate triphosphohydrolase [Verrucomicrobiales bacterium]
MMRKRGHREADELRRLALYAQAVARSAGRSHPEAEHEYRTAYERDRARIIHSRAFRRLEYKTQVFLNGTGDHLRTRLTHTIEVASISRAIAAALACNEDLAEAIALAHDLGHPPFGHAGEEMLDTLMREHGGFEHNRQSRRAIELLERKFTDVPGLNLSYEVIEGLGKHDGHQRRPSFKDSIGEWHPAETFPSPSLEAQIADASDEIAYYSHDLDDGLDHGLLIEGQLEELSLWKKCTLEVTERLPGTNGKERLGNIIRSLTDTMVESLITTTAERLDAGGFGDADDIRRHPQSLVRHESTLAVQMAELRAFLYQNLYHHPDIKSVNARACSLIETMFRHYLKHPEHIGSHTSRRLEVDGVARCVCDYISGMTDRYLVQQARHLRGD